MTLTATYTNAFEAYKGLYFAAKLVDPETFSGVYVGGQHDFIAGVDDNGVFSIYKEIVRKDATYLVAMEFPDSAAPSKVFTVHIYEMS